MIDPLPVTSLYRSYLRQVRQLPHLYLRQFFQIRARDDINAILSMKGERRREIKFKSIQKRVRNIERANNRDVKAFENLLALAYGRIGKLKWELIEPIASHPTGTPLPEPIIRGVEKSRPPVYSPELKALLTSPFARVNRALEPKHFITPRGFPPRADPASEEARTFGPLSKRREVNIRWRFFRTEVSKVLPPLEVTFQEDVSETETQPAPFGMQGSGVMRDLESVIGKQLFVRPPKTRRERRSMPGDFSSSSSSSSPSSSPLKNHERHPSRWLRRRYRGLLSKIPKLVYQANLKKDGGFLVEKHPLGHHPHNHGDKCMPEADDANLAWINLPESEGKTKKRSK